MKKPLQLLLSFLAVIVLGSPAYAQLPLLLPSQLFNAGTALGRYANKKASDRPITVQDYQGRHYPMQRTAASKLPRQDAELITTLETQLDQCHAALLADATGPVCSPDQRVALQEALVNLVRAQLHWSTEAYRQEMDFYAVEDARRRQAAAPAPAE